MSATASSNPSSPPEDTPNDVFKRMVIGNEKQNKALTRKFSKNAGDYQPNANIASQDKQSRVTYMRFLVCLLGVLSLAISQMNRMVINICITKMIDPSMIAPKSQVSDDDSCPRLEDELPTTVTQFPTTHSILDIQTGQTTIASLDPILYFMTLQNTEATTTQFTTTEITTTENLDSNFTTTNNELELTTLPAIVTEVNQVDKFKWNMKQQSYLLGGFFWSYFLFMILGGWIAETYGAKYVLLLGVVGSSIISVFTPLMARSSLTLLVVSRIVMGCLQSGVFPAMYAVVSKWLTMSEASIFAPMIKMNLRLGMLAASAVPGFIAGWPNIFYFTGSVGIIWSILWFILSTSDPKDNRWVSRVELDHILRKKRKQPQEDQEQAIEMSTKGDEIGQKKEMARVKSVKNKTPWLKIITNPSVIGLIIVKYSFNTGADFLSIELPSYLNYVHHVPTEKISVITSCVFAIQVSLIVSVGWLAKTMIKTKPFNISKTGVRKIFQCLANFGVGSCLLLITLNDCRLIYVIVVLQFYSLLSMFAAGGETMLPYDLSDQYPATIMAIANSVSNLSGITITSLAGFILKDRGGSYYRWNLLMYLISGANILGGLAFIILVKAEPIDFEEKKTLDVESSGLSGTLNGSLATSETKPQGEKPVNQNEKDQNQQL